MESLEKLVREQASTISDLKHELFMLKLDVERLSLKATLQELSIDSLERRHENLLNFSLNKVQIK